MIHESGGPAGEPTLLELDSLIETIAELAQRSLSRDEFYGQLLVRTVEALAAVGGIVWTHDGAESLHALRRTGVFESESGAGAEPADWHRMSAAWVLAHRSARAVPPAQTVTPDALTPNPSPWLLLFAPWGSARGASGVVEIAQRPNASPSVLGGYLRFLEAVCELLVDFEQHEQMRAMERHHRRLSQIEEFSRHIHASLDLLPTCYAIANESRRLLECDRVSVLVRHGSACRLIAVSGADSFSRRANCVQFLERVAGAVVAAGDALWHPAGEALPPQIEAPLDAYLDESHATGVGILPLRAVPRSDSSAEAKTLGAMVVECFYRRPDEPLRETTAALVPHIALALQNALVLARLPLGRFLRRLGSLVHSLRGRRLAVCGIVAAAILGVVAALSLVPADFSVEARGELLPLVSRDVFAPDDGVVRELRVQSGNRVDAGQVLLVLRKSALDLELKRVGGELQTATKKLASVESEQLLNRREDETQRRRYTELTAQQEELRAAVASLQAQHAILRQQQAELEVRSPIRGEVLTWNAEQLLTGRPVARGQVLLSVADLSGPWHLELRVPERRMLHLAEATRKATDGLAVSFAMATDPGHTLWGKVDQIGTRTEITESEGGVVLVTASLDREELAERVPGAGVVARVHCGRRAVGYVWFHDLIDAVQTWMWF